MKRAEYMFTYLKLKNFKTFKDVEIDLQSKKKMPKSLIVVYGANGSGKTTVSQAFQTLKRTMTTMQVKGILKDLLDEKLSPPDDFPLKPDVMLSMIKSRLLDNGIDNIINECKMIDSSDNMALEYGFYLNGKHGYYYLEMDDSSIVRERMEYTLNKNKSCYFEIDKEKVYINEKLFQSNEFLEIILKQLEMYRGKHSLLSILLFEMTDKAQEYINANIMTNLINVVESFMGINYKIRQSMDGESISIDSSKKMIEDFEEGIIEKKDIRQLHFLEDKLNKFFISLFDDILKAYYKLKEKDGKIRYRLYLRKRIENHEFDISFKLESNGTKEILELMPYLMLAMSGKSVIIDEYGIGIHDVLSTKLLKSIASNIDGQLILTTHNMLIMDKEAELQPEALYFIMNDGTFKKSVKCVTEIEDRLHPNYNYRNRYLYNDAYKDSLPKLIEELDLTELAGLYK